MNDSATMSCALVGVPDAHECFGGNGAAAAEIDDGLVLDAEAVFVHGAAEHALHTEPADGPRAQIGVEHLPAIPSAVLGSVERQVGLLEEPCRAVVGVRGGRDADAGRAHELLVADLERDAARGDDPITERDRLFEPRDVLDQDGELVATEARERVLRPQGRAEPLGHLQQHGVAHEVAERVVDELEAVEIEEEDGHQPVAPLDAAQGLLQPVHEDRAIGNAGQGVGGRLSPEVEVRAPAIADVADRGHDQRLGPVAHDHRHRLGPPVRTVCAAEARHRGQRHVGQRRRLVTRAVDEPCVVGVDEVASGLSDQIVGCPAEPGEARGRDEAVDAVDRCHRVEVGRTFDDEAVEQRRPSRIDCSRCHRGSPFSRRRRRHRGPGQRVPAVERALVERPDHTTVPPLRHFRYERHDRACHERPPARRQSWAFRPSAGPRPAGGSATR
jgi:hypothetical protein